MSPEAPLESPWRVCFSLEHVPPGRSWDREFDAAILRRRSLGSLLYQHDIVREGSASYPYRPRPSRWALLLRRFHKRRVAVQSICPPDSRALESALAEVRSLVGEANQAYADSTRSRAHVERERDVALGLLEQAVERLESGRGVTSEAGQRPRIRRVQGDRGFVA